MRLVERNYTPKKMNTKTKNSNGPSLTAKGDSKDLFTEAKNLLKRCGSVGEKRLMDEIGINRSDAQALMMVLVKQGFATPLDNPSNEYVEAWRWTGKGGSKELHLTQEQGNEIIDETVDKVHRMLDICDNMRSIIRELEVSLITTTYRCAQYQRGWVVYNRHTCKEMGCFKTKEEARELKNRLNHVDGTHIEKRNLVAQRIERLMEEFQQLPSEDVESAARKAMFGIDE